MLRAIAQAGAFNTTVLVVLAALVWAASRRTPRVPPWGVRLAVLAVAAGTAANVAVGVYRAYTVPRDVMQDIVAAREFAAGRSMQPDDMTDRIRAALAEEGPRGSLVGWSPELARHEREQLDHMLHEHWVQAHPPFMTLVTVPFVRLFGVLGTQLAFAAVALAALGWTLAMIRRELWPGVEWPLVLLAALAVYGWAPVVSVVRLQQPGLVLVALLTFAWVSLRRGRQLRAGSAVALAAALKVIPVILVVPMLAHHRRAVAAAAVTGATVAAVVLVEVPWADLVAYRATAAGVVDEYAAYPANISLLGMFARAARALDLPLAVAKVAWQVTGGLLVVAWLWALARRGGRESAPDVDLEFAIGMGLMPLLSPVAWDHYDAFLILPLAVLAHRLRWGGAGRRSWVAFWGVVAFLSLPEPAYLWAYESARAAGWVGLEVGVLEPLRTFLGLGVVAWLIRLRRFPVPA